MNEWFRKGTTGGPTPAPRLRGDYEIINGYRSISFLELVEVLVAGRLRDGGISLQSVRRAHRKLRDDWDTEHPFSRQDIRTDGENVFARVLDGQGKLVHDVLAKNRVFASVLLPVLRRIDYDPTSGMARRWHLSDSVVLDPEVCYGKPTVESVGITTRVLSGSYYANDRSLKAVAGWFEIEEEHVAAAVDFESKVAA